MVCGLIALTLLGQGSRARADVIDQWVLEDATVEKDVAVRSDGFRIPNPGWISLKMKFRTFFRGYLAVKREVIAQTVQLASAEKTGLIDLRFKTHDASFCQYPPPIGNYAADRADYVRVLSPGTYALKIDGFRFGAVVIPEDVDGETRAKVILAESPERSTDADADGAAAPARYDYREATREANARESQRLFGEPRDWTISAPELGCALSLRPGDEKTARAPSLADPTNFFVVQRLLPGRSSTEDVETGRFELEPICERRFGIPKGWSAKTAARDGSGVRIYAMPLAGGSVRRRVVALDRSGAETACAQTSDATN